MKTKFIFLLFVSYLLLPGGGTVNALGHQAGKIEGTRAAATNLIRAALEAMGGEIKIRQLKSLQFEGIGHNYAVEQSERPGGPFIVSYQQNTELRDLINQRERVTAQIRQFQTPEWSPVAALVVGEGYAAGERNGKFSAVSSLQIDNTLKKLALAPEQIFLKALEAGDLRLDKDVLMQDVSQKVIKFTWNNIPVTIYLNATTNLPTAVETLDSSPYEHFWSIWGDFTERTYYSLWSLERGGIRYPRQWDVERNGAPFYSFTVTKLQLNTPIDEKLFFVPEDVRQKFSNLPKPLKIDEIPLGRPDRPPGEIAPGVIKISGRWDIAFVKQTDGIVVIEAPISSGYSVKVLQEAERRFPGSKVKAVITTSDAFPHLGGVREYAFRGIPIYALDLNRPILERVIAAPHTMEPDALQKKPRKATFRIVSGKTVLGEGTNRIEIYPIRSETGERMMLVYFPEHRMLYASDLIQKGREGFFMPQYLSEVLQAAGREKLSVDSVFAMHLPLTPWKEVTDAVERLVSDR